MTARDQLVLGATLSLIAAVIWVAAGIVTVTAVRRLD